jgi:hypothetical protein
MLCRLAFLLSAVMIALPGQTPWAFQPPVKIPVPGTPGAESTHPIDAFVNARLGALGITAAPRADHRTLIRRLALDLTGLPPEQDDFRLTYAQAIEKYLGSPHYGERWGRHWLDLARYADSNGYEHDFDRPNAWRYRDYVIRCFNQDKPFSQFLREQIAGDELPEPDNDALIATGFLRSHAKVGYREKDNPQFRLEYLDDMIATVGRGLLGMTIQCARCHNHKFDPITQRDYYRLQSSLWGYVEVDHPLVPPEQAAQWRAANDAVDARLKVLRGELGDLEKPYKDKLLPDKLKKYPPNVLEAIATPEDKRTEGQVLLANQVLRTTSVSGAEAERIMTAEDRIRRSALLQRMKALESERPPAIPLAMGITDGDFRFTPDGPGDEPAPGKGVRRETSGTYLHQGQGLYKVPPGSPAKPGFPAVLVKGDPPVELPPAHGRTSGRRLALAEWLISPDNPLTARVFVNRVWHHHFGRGLAASVDNFGKTGDAPTHPELLDWLAVHFMESGWRIKDLHRLILTSQTYQRSSAFLDAAATLKDADNQFLWRFRAQRLEAEAVRDSMLAVAGNLNRQIGGPAVFPPLPAETLAQMKYGIWMQGEDGPGTWRRSVYVYRKRGLPFPFFEAFDLPDQNISCGRRNVSTVPTQSLTLLNNDFVLRQSARLAARVREMTVQPERQAQLTYQLALGRPPLAAELDAAMAYLREGTLDGLAHVLFNTSEFLYLR